MPCPEQVMILEAATPVLSVGLLVTLVLLVREIQLSVKTWRARRQRRQVRQVAAIGLVEAKALPKALGVGCPDCSCHRFRSCDSSFCRFCSPA